MEKGPPSFHLKQFNIAQKAQRTTLKISLSLGLGRGKKTDRQVHLPIAMHACWTMTRLTTVDKRAFSQVLMNK